MSVMQMRKLELGELSFLLENLSAPKWKAEWDVIPHADTRATLLRTVLSCFYN